MRALDITLIAAYGMTAVAYLARMVFAGTRLKRIARRGATALLFVHLAAIGAHCLSGFHPLLGLSGVLSLTAFLLVSGFLAVSLKWPLASAGSAVLFLGLALVVTAHLTAGLRPQAGLPQALGKLHLALVACSGAAFALSSAVSLVYLRQDLALKRNQIGSPEDPMPSLAALDSLSLKLALTGLPLLALALMTGTLWTVKLRLGWRPENLLAGGAFLIYCLMLLFRAAIGIRGRAAAWATILGFLLVVVVLCSYALRRVAY